MRVTPTKPFTRGPAPPLTVTQLPEGYAGQRIAGLPLGFKPGRQISLTGFDHGTWDPRDVLDPD